MIKFISVDVSALNTHSEKLKVFDSFRELGWLEFKHFAVAGEYPNINVKKWGFCWDSDETQNLEPQYPSIPAQCSLSDFDNDSSNE